MSTPALGKTTVRQKAVSELKEWAAISVYLYICFGAIVMYKSAILRDVGVDVAVWGIAAAKAIILGKFMLLGRLLHLEKRYRDRPLVIPTLVHAVIFLAILLVLTMLEEVAVGLLHHEAVIESLSHAIGSTFFESLAVSFIMFLILIPYSAFICLGEVLGEREIFRLFFMERSAVPKRE